MKLSNLRTSISTIERMERTVSRLPFGIDEAIASLTHSESQLVMATIERVLMERRDNVLDRLRSEGVNIDETA